MKLRIWSDSHGCKPFLWKLLVKGVYYFPLRQQCWLIVAHLLRWSLYPATTRGSQLVCMPANPPVTADTKIEDFLFVKLSANSQTAAQVYSSSENWPLKPFSNTTVYNFLVQSSQSRTRCKIRSWGLVCPPWPEYLSGLRSASATTIRLEFGPPLWPGTITGQNLQYPAETLTMLFQLHFPA